MLKSIVILREVNIEMREVQAHKTQIQYPLINWIKHTLIHGSLAAKRGANTSCTMEIISNKQYIAGVPVQMNIQIKIKHIT